MITPILAQEQLSDLSAGFWKDFCIALLVLLGVVAVVAGIWAAIRKPAPQKLDDNPPIEVRKAPKRYNHDAVENRFGNIELRLDGHDAELNELRSEHNVSIKGIERSLGRIEGRLGIPSEQKS